jgi:hypothetical membrane protein
MIKRKVSVVGGSAVFHNAVFNNSLTIIGVIIKIYSLPSSRGRSDRIGGKNNGLRFCSLGK